MEEKEPNYQKIVRCGCLNYNSIKGCKTCDGFGINTEQSIGTQECYVSLNKMRLYLDIAKDNRN